MSICKNPRNDQLLFDYMCEVIETRENSGVITNDIRKKEKKVIEAIFDYYKEPEKKYIKKIEALGVTTDLPIITKDAFNFTIGINNYDLGWERAFKTIQLGKYQDQWEICDLSDNILFKRIAEGGKIELGKPSGNKITADVSYFGGGFTITDKIIRFRKLYQIIELIEMSRNKYIENKGNNHYTLLAAAVSETIAYQGVVADSRVQRVIKTINQAQFRLGDKLKNKGYGDMANAVFLIYANPVDQEILESAFVVTANSLAAAGTAGGGDASISQRRMPRIYTYNSNITAGRPIMLLPGVKLQKAEPMSLTTYEAAIDILSLNREVGLWAIYGAIAADTEQVLDFRLS